MSTKSITLNAEDARWALRAALSGASKDDVTPVLCAVEWSIADGKVRIIATDRYVVHEAFITAPDDAPDGVFLMHRDQAQWMLANSHKPLRLYASQLVRIEWTEPNGATPTKHSTPQERRSAAGSIAVEILGSKDEDAPSFRYVADAVRGNFPPVRRLFPEMKDDGERFGEVALSPTLLTRLAHLTRHRGEPLRFMMPKVTEGKAGPVLVQNGDGTARALVQPNIMMTSKAWQG